MKQNKLSLHKFMNNKNDNFGDRLSLNKNLKTNENQCLTKNP